MQAEQTEHKLVELEGHIEDMEKRFSTLVQDVITKTDRLEQVIHRQLSYHSADAGAANRSEGRFKDSLRGDDDIPSDDNDTSTNNKNKGSSVRRSKQFGNKLAGIDT
jgi:TolA-binding protein